MMDKFYIEEQHECQTNYIDTLQEPLVYILGSNNVAAELAFWLSLSGARVELITDHITMDYLHFVSEYNSVLKSRPLCHLFKKTTINIAKKLPTEIDGVVIVVGQHQESRHYDDLTCNYYVLSEGITSSTPESTATRIEVQTGDVLPSTPLYLNPYKSEYTSKSGNSIPLDVLFAFVIQTLVPKKVVQNTKLIVPAKFTSEAVAIHQCYDLASTDMFEHYTRHEVNLGNASYCSVYEQLSDNKIIFLINAIGMPTLFFSHIASYLAKSFSVVVIEIPLALTENEKGSDYFHVAAQLINTIIQRYQTAGTVHVLGWSTGCELIERASLMSTLKFRSVYISPYLSLTDGLTSEASSSFITTLLSMSKTLNLNDPSVLSRGSSLIRLAKKNRLKSVAENESQFLQSLSSDTFRIPKKLGLYLKALSSAERKKTVRNKKDKVMIISGGADSITTPQMTSQYAEHFASVRTITLQDETHHSCFNSLPIWQVANNFFKES